MSWRSGLRAKTRDPQFLWQLGIGILLAGVIVGFAARWLPPAVGQSLIGAGADTLSRHHQQVNALAAAGDWSAVWWSIPRGMWLSTLPGPASIAGLAGICWLVFLLQAGQPGCNDGLRWWLAPAAVVLGVLSIWPTFFAIYFQQHRWQLEASLELVEGLRFFVLGVGLREELAKLLLFLPLVPLVIRRGSQREAMLSAACVGLGFAMEENVGYFTGDPSSSIQRFLLSNFLHMSLTGLAGLAICRAIWWPGECAADAVGTVLLAIVLHGVFDAMLVLPALAEYSIVSFIIYILLAYRFFHELRSWWQPRGETISLTATFVAAVALVAAATFVYFAAATNLTMAASGIVLPGLSSAIFVYMFLREMPESLIR